MNEEVEPSLSESEHPSADPGLVTPATPLQIVDFLESPAPDPSVELAMVPNDPPVRKFLAIAEAAGWWVGTVIVHAVAAFFMLILLTIVAIAIEGKRVDQVSVVDMIPLMTTGEMLLFVPATILAYSLRYWGRALRELNLSRPDGRHILMVLGATIPLSLCVSLWSLPVQMVWNLLKEHVSGLEIFDGSDVTELVQQVGNAIPLPLLIIVIAVAPAIGEEVVFRGAIGRVLIANLGLVAGILLTSFLFGWIHLHPVHSISVIPIGIALHLIYLWTRSFWMPMLLHFLNNSWATVAIDMQDPLESELTISTVIMIAFAIIAVCGFGYCLWQSRVRYRGPDGQEVDLGRFPLRVPTQPGTVRFSIAVSPLPLLLSVVSTVVVHGLILRAVLL